MTLDIEENDRWGSSVDVDQTVRRTTAGPASAGSVRQQKRTNEGSLLDPVAVKAINRLGRIYVPLKSARTTRETLVVLRQMRHTYADIFNKPRQIAALLTCQYYLWRLRRRGMS